MPKRKPKDKLLTVHIQVLFTENERFILNELSLNSSAQGNISRFIREIVLQAIQPAEVVTSVSTAPIAE